ncbi:wd40 repeat-containing nuclear protein [Moniliophthora roreri MCA 2997]|uniref:Wd40 repeat-containing nuclear protein n=1 Tax=Moniliophthora roreri (strain MCA 2997) TaxID=1381753 RepID=V2Y9F5_MONRO|nr:wd40 repeat-containing nuclear protein [Moniliophthora roreri MCA 2997]
MENRSIASSSLHDLFSRGSTPPQQPIQQQQAQQPQPTQPQQQQQQPSTQYLTHNVSSNQIESLFQNLSASPSDHHHHSSASASQSAADDFSNPTTPPVMSIQDDPVASPPASISSISDRQSALLSLLGGPSSAPATSSSSTSQQPQQIPTPPGSSQRSGASPSHNEAQGKFLLEQLMAGNPPRSNYSESQRTSSIPGSAPTPPSYGPGAGPSQHESTYQRTQLDPAPELTQQQQQYHSPEPPQSQSMPPTQPQPPSPRKSMFDFVSPFDALSTSGVSSKKKPAPPPPPPQPASISSGLDDEWTTVADPKRQSVDNLLESLARAQIPPPAYDTTNYYTASANDYLQAQVPPPILPKPSGVPNRTASPRASPPKPHAQRAARMDSPQGQAMQQQQQQPTNNNNHNRRDKESSPGPGSRGSLRAKGGRNYKSVNSPSQQVQNIVFDVSQPLDEIQAPRDAVKSTAIALVRQDTVFLPGTTIGATHWVAYAMTRGRIRVISRSSGDRTLLTLPPPFPPGASVTDMAVHGNRLAGVTSDGGFVVWELPELITDDVPGQLLLCVTPSNDHEPLQLVKWNPKEPDQLAVASESQIYLLDLGLAHALRGQSILQSDLHQIGQIFSLSSPLVAFDFDVIHFTLASISVDSTLTIWNVQDQLPYSTHKVRGEDIPSSLTFVDGGIVVGRKNGTIFQLLSMTTKSVLSTIKFVNGSQEDPDMFGHANYDSRIQTLWVANCRRDSIIGLKISLEPSVANGEEAIRGYFDQVVEFTGPKPTIHFVILTPDSDPNGDEAYAACIAAKVPPGELALVAFSVHSSGVDQILIRKEWFDSALNSTVAKFPPYTALHQPPQQMPSTQMIPPPQPEINVAPTSHLPAQPARLRTPPSEEIEADITRDEVRAEGGKGKGKGGKVKFGEEKERSDKNSKGGDSALMNETALGQVLTREIRKTEDNLHNRISKLLSKAMDTQNQRMEEARAHDQQEDFQRQETILKLISTELTRNTTRVVEMAVKNEVQNSVLPSLENITKNEVRAALNDQVGTGLVDYIGQSLPMEIEKLLLRPDVSAHFSHLLSNNLTTLIDRHIKDAVSKNLLPLYSQQSSAMHQEFMRELRNEIHGFKAEISNWQNDTMRGQENSIRDLQRTVQALSDQVKYLSLNHTGSAIHHIQQAPQPHHGSPANSGPSNMSQSHLRQQNVQTSLPPPSSQVSSNNYSGPPQQSMLNQPWYSTNIAAPQASHPATIPPPPPPPQTERTPPIKPEQWDEIYLGVLHTQDASKLRDLLAHTNPELIMPLNGQVLVSQAVILTLVHRLSAMVGELSPTDESLKTSLWWLQRAVALLRPEDKLITDFIPRVIPNVQVLLNTTKQRLAIPVPGGPPTLDIARSISDVQESLRRKVAPVS